MKKVYNLVGYARSGVTVFNRCLASDDRLICLSEINSRFLCPASPNTPHEQMKDWYDVTIPTSSVLKEINDIKKYADKQNKTLLIRDWSFGSFVPLKYNDFSPPQILNTVDDLSNQHPVVLFCIVRDPVDVWLSMRDSPKTFHDKYLEYLYLFVEDVLRREIKIFKYEDFCSNPLETLKAVYKLMDLNPINKVVLSNNVTGDINTPISSRGIHLDKVIKLKRRILKKEDIDFLLNETKITEIMKMLNYKNPKLRI